MNLPIFQISMKNLYEGEESFCFSSESKDFNPSTIYWATPIDNIQTLKALFTAFPINRLAYMSKENTYIFPAILDSELQYFKCQLKILWEKEYFCIIFDDLTFLVEGVISTSQYFGERPELFSSTTEVLLLLRPNFDLFQKFVDRKGILPVGFTPKVGEFKISEGMYIFPDLEKSGVKEKV